MSPAGAEQYGAIALSPSKLNYGYSYDFDTRAAAEDKAMKQCGEKDCAVAAWYRDACGAVARGDNESWGVDWGVDTDEASPRAIARCNEKGQNCKLDEWMCASGKYSGDPMGCSDRIGAQCSQECGIDSSCHSACMRRNSGKCD